jgi:hypothetical protein
MPEDASPSSGLGWKIFLLSFIKISPMFVYFAPDMIFRLTKFLISRIKEKNIWFKASSMGLDSLQDPVVQIGQGSKADRYLTCKRIHKGNDYDRQKVPYHRRGVSLAEYLAFNDIPEL